MLNFNTKFHEYHTWAGQLGWTGKEVLGVHNEAKGLLNLNLKGPWHFGCLAMTEGLWKFPSYLCDRFTKCLIHLINVLNIYKMSDTFDKSFKHLLIVSYIFEMFLHKYHGNFQKLSFTSKEQKCQDHMTFVIFQACAWFQSAYNLA